MMLNIGAVGKGIVFGLIATVSVVLVVGCDSVASTANSSIFEGFEPCTRAGVEDRDPCEVRQRFGVPGQGSRLLPESPPSYEQLLFNAGEDHSLDEIPPIYLSAATHIVARGTYEPGSTRCASYPYLFPAWIFDEGESPYPEIPEGETVTIQGVWDLYSWECFTTFKVGEWLVGGGPGSIVVSHPHLGSTYSINDTPSIESYAEELDAFRDLIADAYEGYEWVLWLGTPPITSVLSLAAYHYWDVQRDENGTVRVVSPDFEYYDYEGLTSAELGKLNPALAEFRRGIAAAHEARVARTSGRVGVQTSTPMLVTDASMLASHFDEIGGPTNIVATPAPAPAESE